MELTDLLSLEEWTALEKALHAASGLDVSVFNKDGIRITEYKEWVNRLCPAVKASDKGQAFICAVAHMNIAAQADQTGAPVIEECDAGLVKLVVPIRVKDLFLGSIGACGLLLDDGEVDSFMIHRTIGMEEDEIESLAVDIGAISMADARKLAETIQQKIKSLTAS